MLGNEAALLRLRYALLSQYLALGWLFTGKEVHVSGKLGEFSFLRKHLR